MSLSDAEIAQLMNWRGPGSYTQHAMRRVRRVIDEAERRARSHTTAGLVGVPPEPTFNEITNMNTTQQRMTEIFNEWVRRYADNPDEFGSILDADGKPVEDYGQRCTLYFDKIADEMDAAGQLPRPGMVPKLAPWPKPPNAKLPGGREAG